MSQPCLRCPACSMGGRRCRAGGLPLHLESRWWLTSRKKDPVPALLHLQSVLPACTACSPLPAALPHWQFLPSCEWTITNFEGACIRTCAQQALVPRID